MIVVSLVLLWLTCWSITKTEATKIVVLLLLLLLRWHCLFWLLCWLRHWSTTTKHIKKIHSTVTTSSIVATRLLLLILSLVLLVKVSRFQILDCIYLLVLARNKLIELQSIFDLLKSLKCLLHIIIYKHEACRYVLILNFTDLVMEFWFHFLECLKEVDYDLVLLEILSSFAII